MKPSGQGGTAARDNIEQRREGGGLSEKAFSERLPEAPSFFFFVGIWRNVVSFVVLLLFFFFFYIYMNMATMDVIASRPPPEMRFPLLLHTQWTTVDEIEGVR